MGLLASSQAATELTFLKTRGQDIINGNGDKVMLRGVGLGNWMLPEGYMWKFGKEADRPRRIEKLVSDLLGPAEARDFWTNFRANYITETDITRISELGFNSVRPALNARLFLVGDNYATADSEGFRLLDNLVGWCKQHRVYVIIDMHGAPGGQTGQNIDDSANDQPELFMNPKHQQELVALWTAIARRYKDEPAVAGFDLLNEPLPSRTGAAGKFKKELEPLYKRLTKAIRAVDSKHMVIVEGFDWANDWSEFTKPFDPNLVYQFHYYCWDTPVRLKGIGHYLSYRDRFNAPVWVGETGERDSAIYWATTEYFEARNIGWCFWPWKKMDAENGPYSCKRPPGWDAVVAYSQGETKPTSEVASNAFAQLLKNVRLENCDYHPNVVNAMLRRVPLRIEAENFGQEGKGASYSVQTDAHSKFYRLDDPVSVTVVDSQRRRSEQYITLNAGEWTAYKVDNQKPAQFELSIRARAEKDAEAELQLDGRSFVLKIPAGAWAEQKLGPVTLEAGAHQVKWTVTRGQADLDWIGVNAGPQVPQKDS